MRCVCNDLGQILKCGFNLASKNFSFLLERACVARYRTEYASVKDFKGSMSKLVAPCDYMLIICLDLQKRGYRNLSYIPAD